MRRSLVLALATLVSLGSVAACRSAEPQATPAPAASAAAPNGFTGTVAETMNAGGYTYARLQADGKDVWIAAPEFATKNGERLTAVLEMPMPNFESKTLNRTFPMVYFVTAVSRDGQVVSGGPAAAGAKPADAKPALMTSHGPTETPTTVEPIAPPAGGLSIADVWAQRKALSGKEVTIRGKVVKANNGILGTNWIHLQDGSRSAQDRTNDLTITTNTEVNVGDVITITGVLATGKDIGSGYAYDAIVENAKVIR